MILPLPGCSANWTAWRGSWHRCYGHPWKDHGVRYWPGQPVVASDDLDQVASRPSVGKTTVNPDTRN